MSPSVLSYVAKQPILDREKKVYGYELLFRSGPDRQAYDGTDGSQATQQVIAQSVLNIGLEHLVGRGRAFVNFGREILLEDWHVELPKQTAVIEILETVEPDEAVVHACRRLKDAGYLLALDDFAMQPGWEPLVKLADLIKVEMESLDTAGHRALVRHGHARRTSMLVERVETEEQFEQAKAAGYDYFQGYFFARPSLVISRQIPTIKVNCLNLMQEAQRPTLDFLLLEQLIKRDVSLAYKLLRYANSALFAHPSEIHSLREALLFVPEARMRRWIWLASLPMLATEKPEELLALAITRAWMCEGLARMAGVSQDQAFLTGLLSLVPALADLSMDRLLAQLCLSEEVAAILRGQAPATRLGFVHELTRAHESGDWATVDWLREKLGLSVPQVSGAYLQAIHNANTIRT